MVKRGVKRKNSSVVDEDDSGEFGGHRKKPAIDNLATPGQERGYASGCEQVVKEFVKFAGVKQTRLKGLMKFLKTLKTDNPSKCEIILKYLQNRPSCTELFQVLEEKMEERSLLEVQTVIEILEIILLQLAEEDMRGKSRSAAIITTIFNRHRKFVYNCLNSSSPARTVAAMLKLFTAIVMHGPTIAKELLTTFDFSHKTFAILVNRRDKKDVGDVRTCFIKFLLSFFVTGDTSLIQQVIQIKGFATSIFKNLHTNSPEIIHLVLSTLLVKTVQNSSILKKTKILLFTSYSLTQLVKLYSYDKDSAVGPDMSVRDRLHSFLLELCASSSGIAFENPYGIFSSRSNNPVLLRFLHSLPKTIEDDLLVELVIKILIHSQDLITPYLLDCQMALEPRNSNQWSRNVLFLIKLYFLFPLPSLILDGSSVLPESTSLSKLLTLVCPVIIKRNILTRGLLHADVLVQTTTLSMLLIILRRSVNLMKCVKVDPKLLQAFQEDILKVLPSFQILISIRENLLNRTNGTAERHKRDRSQSVDNAPFVAVSSEDAKPLLSRALAAMNMYQTLCPNSFTQAGYDPWKILPRNGSEEHLYNLSCEHSMLQILLNSPPRNFKWQLQSKGEAFQGLYQILDLYYTSRNVAIQSLARETVERLFLETGVFEDNKVEIKIWLRNLLDECLEGNLSVIMFMEKVYCYLASDLCDFVDTVLESANAVSMLDESYPIPYKDVTKRTMLFSPLVAAALKLFGEWTKNSDKDEKNIVRIEFVARFLNLVLLDILPSQCDPRPLHSVILKYLAQDDIFNSALPVQTRNVVYYIGQWCPGIEENILEEDQRTLRKSKSPSKKQGISEVRNNTLVSTSKQLMEKLRSLPSGIDAVVSYLKYNPVSLLGCSTSSEFVTVLNNLSCPLVLQQLSMFVVEYWESGAEIADTEAFEQLAATLLSSVRNDSLEYWDRTATGCMFLIYNLIQLHLKNFQKQRMFMVVNRTIVEVLRNLFHRVWEHKQVHQSQDTSSCETSSESAMDDRNGNVVSVVDGIGLTTEQTLDYEDVFLKCLETVFGHVAFQNWFYCYVGLKTDEVQFSTRFISSVVSSCVAELMSDLQEHISCYSDLGIWKPYWLRIANRVKAFATNEPETDFDLPFNIEITSLVKIFCNHFPASKLNEIVLAFLDLPREELTALLPMKEGCRARRNSLTVKGEVFVTLLDCFLSKEDPAAWSERTRICLNYISEVSWPKLTELLLGETSVKYSREHFQLMSFLLESQESEYDTIQKLFKDLLTQKHLVGWNLYHLQTFEALLQFFLRSSSNEKYKGKYRAAFFFACMRKLTIVMESARLEGLESLRLKTLGYLEKHGNEPLRLKANDNFTAEKFMNVTNTFIKSALRSFLSCGPTLRVLVVVIKTVHQCGSKKSAMLMPLSDVYQFILSHSKFLEIFLQNSEHSKYDGEAKGALVDLLQTVVDLEPKCCHHSHLSLILGAYSAKLGLTDQKLLRLLFTYEAAVGELTVGSRVLWGEAAIERYEANKRDPATLWHQPNIVQVLDLMDSKLLLQSAKHFPIHKQLQPILYTSGNHHSQFYDPSFLLPLFSFFMAPDCEVNCRKFVDRSALAYTLSALTSTDQRMRQVAYQILSRFLVHLSGSHFKEKQQVSHLLHCFQNGILEPNARISSLIVSFTARALHIFFYPEDPLYVSVNSYILQKPFLDLRVVPLFLSLINSSGLGHRTERTWLLHLLISGIRDPMDYYICKKYHVFQQLFSLYNCSIADQHFQNLILKVILQVSRLRAPVYDLCHNYGVLPWLHFLVASKSLLRDSLHLVVDILQTIWFTLSGGEVSLNDYRSEGNTNMETISDHPPLPKNVCSELLVVCLSILQKDASLDVWDQDTFVTFARLLASLLDRQDIIHTSAKVTLTKHHAIKITKIWNILFGDTDIVGKLKSLLNWDSSLTNDPCEVISAKWFRSMCSVLRISNALSMSELPKNEESKLFFESYSCLTKPVGRFVEAFVLAKLRRALQMFLEPSVMENCHNGSCD